MKPALRFLILFVFSIFFNPAVQNGLAEPLPLKRVVELAIRHSTVTGATAADEQRAFASYHEARNQYLPTLVVGSGLGATWGYPLSLEGSAPSIVNVTAQSAVLNPSVRDFVRAARQEWTASSLQAKDARSQVVQDAVLSYAELSKWEGLLNHLQQQQEQDERMEQIVEERIRAGVDNLLARSKAQLATARMRLHLAQAHGAIDVLRDHLSKLTGLPAPSIETAAESIPALPEVRQTDDLAGKTVQTNAALQAANEQASEQTLKLQRSVEQLAAFQQVSQLEYEVAQANANALQVRLDAGTASFHDLEDARDQANERFNALQDANFEVERARIALLRATGELENWVGVGK